MFSLLLSLSISSLNLSLHFSKQNQAIHGFNFGGFKGVKIIETPHGHDQKMLNRGGRLIWPSFAALY